jgi:hypothetical protein
MRAFRLAGAMRWALLPVLIFTVVGCASHEDQVTREFMFVPSMPPPPDPVVSGDTPAPMLPAPAVEAAPLPPPELPTAPATPAPLVPPSKAITGNVNPGSKGR